jgi:hypothetical protein
MPGTATGSMALGIFAHVVDSTHIDARVRAAAHIVSAEAACLIGAA